MTEILFALLAGIFTIAAPCILPLLPIILGANVGSVNKKRPLFIVFGFVLMFCVANLLLYSLVTLLNLSPDILRQIAVWLLGIFGAFLLWPLPFELLTQKLNPLLNKANQVSQNAGSGNWGGFVLGVMLGVIWAPCAGPILGSILTNIAQAKNFAFAGLQLFAYSLGAGVPMLLIAYGGQTITAKVRFLSQYSKRLQQIFGILIIGLAIAMYFGVDTKIQAQLVEKFPAIDLESRLVGQKPANQQNNKTINNAPQTKKTINEIKLENYGPAPEFSGIYKWLNSDPLTIKQLKGKVVLVDFWTYSCINCIRTLPYVTKWYDTYKDKGLVVVGVHTPEFAFEKVTKNVETAIKRHGINYPVAQDNDFKTWNNYSNRYWPAKYLIDQNGNIVYTHFGEGEYDHTENIIRQLLNLDITLEPNSIRPPGDVRSPEMYFGTSRLEYLSPEQKPDIDGTNEYKFPATLKLNTFALSGFWKFFNDKIQCVANCKIRLKYHASNVYMVATSEKPITISVRLDGDKAAEFSVKESMLYDLIKSPVSDERTLEIEISEPGFEAFALTFG